MKTTYAIMVGLGAGAAGFLLGALAAGRAPRAAAAAGTKAAPVAMHAAAGAAPSGVSAPLVSAADLARCVRELCESPSLRGQRPALARIWGALDPGAALKFAEGLGGPDRKPFLAAVLEGWVTVDASAAWEHGLATFDAEFSPAWTAAEARDLTRRMLEAGRYPYTYAFMSDLTNGKQQDEMMDLMQQVRRAGVTEVFNGLARRPDAEQVLPRLAGWISSVDASPVKIVELADAIQAGLPDSAQKRDLLLSMAAQLQSRTTAGPFAGWVARLDDPPLRDQSYSLLATGLAASRSFAQARAYAERIADPAQRDAAIMTALLSAKTAPPAADLAGALAALSWSADDPRRAELTQAIAKTFMIIR